MKRTNLIFILSDQHNRDLLGSYGHPIVQTPNLDRLAENGTRFTNAYTNCPICVPARASLATGRYVHQIGNWDNAFPYDGSVKSWGHFLRDRDHRVDSIGKLHFGTADEDHGFSNEIDPLHVVDGTGDLLSCIRKDAPIRDKRDEVLNAGPGDSTYLRYDLSNADHACRWLSDHKNDEKPWALFLSFVCPHPPYIAPQNDFDLYPLDQIPLPPQWHESEWPQHSAINYLRRFFSCDKQFNEMEIRKLNATYYGVCTFLDRQIGRVLSAIDENNLSENTRIIYTSDHGDSLGARGLIGKFTMYEESAAIPFIISGVDVPKGKVIETPISLIDCFPTIIEAVCGSTDEIEPDLPGESVWEIANKKDQDRIVFSEYHAVGSENAIYMLRDQNYKYVNYVNDLPQLFDLKNDRNEINDLSNCEDHRSVLTYYEKELHKIVNPTEIDAKAKSDQKRKIEKFGGEQKIRDRGAFDNSPVPGEAPKFRIH